MPYPVFINYLQSVRTLQKTYPAAHIYVFTHICNHVNCHHCPPPASLKWYMDGAML